MEEYEGEKIKRTINKKVLKKSKNILSHLEIIVFEKNIWDILLEIKQKNGVDSFVIEPVDEKRKRETMILYKSDLLFYLQLYAELYPVPEMGPAVGSLPGPGHRPDASDGLPAGQGPAAGALPGDLGLPGQGPPRYRCGPLCLRACGHDAGQAAPGTQPGRAGPGRRAADAGPEL